MIVCAIRKDHVVRFKAKLDGEFLDDCVLADEEAGVVYVWPDERGMDGDGLDEFGISKFVRREGKVEVVEMKKAEGDGMIGEGMTERNKPCEEDCPKCGLEAVLVADGKTRAMRVVSGGRGCAISLGDPLMTNSEDRERILQKCLGCGAFWWSETMETMAGSTEGKG